MDLQLSGARTLVTGDSRGTSAEQAEKAVYGSSLIGRIVEAEQVAAVTFPASPRSVAINGDATAAGGGSPRVIHY